MIVAACLLILAVLLFGAAPVLGAIGRMLSLVAFLAGLALFAVWLASRLDLSVMQIIGGIAGLAFAVMLAYGAICELRGIDPATGRKRR
jgi:hypothetical protein